MWCANHLDDDVFQQALHDDLCQAVHACRQCPNAIDKLPIGAIFKPSHPVQPDALLASMFGSLIAAQKMLGRTQLRRMRPNANRFSPAASSRPRPPTVFGNLVGS